MNDPTQYQQVNDVRAASVGASFLIKILVWFTAIVLVTIDTANGKDVLDAVVNLMYTVK